MKKIIVLLTLLCVASFAQCNASLFAGGAGTKNVPYKISTPRQLSQLNNCLGEVNKNKYYMLIENIDLTEFLSEGNPGYNNGAGWNPIGADASVNYFYGKFNGAGHKITGLWIKRPSQNSVGLFGEIGPGAEIKNLGVDIDTVKGGIKGNEYVGGLAGGNQGIIDKTYATGVVRGERYVGGLVGGYNFGPISNSYATGTVTGRQGIGGLVGYNKSTISNSYTTSAVTGSLTDIGGLVGGNIGGTVNNSHATGVVTGGEGNLYDYNDGAGGLIGVNVGGFISNSYATCTVTGSLRNIGGLVGRNISSTIIKSYATGSVNGKNYVGGLVGLNGSSYVDTSYATGVVRGERYVGGLVGSNSGHHWSNGTWDNPISIVGSSYATGTVTGESSVGGLTGDNNKGIVANSYAMGALTGINYVGGLVGYNDEGTVTNSYAMGTVSGKISVGGLTGSNGKGTVSNSYAIGAVMGTKDVGGLVGKNEKGFVSSGYYDTETSRQNDIAGKGADKTTAEMKSKATFDGWDFGKIWTIDAKKNDGFPYLRKNLPVERKKEDTASSDLQNPIIESSNEDVTNGYAKGGSDGIGKMLNGVMNSGDVKVSVNDILIESGGIRSKTDIMKVANARTHGLRNIYNKYLKLKPDFGGKILLKFTITPSGDIASVDIVSSSTSYPEFDDQIKKKVGSWRWKVIKTGNTIVTIPFNFTE